MQTGAGQLGRNLAQGPRQVAAILARLQTRLEEQRLSMQLQAQRDMPVDVQVEPVQGSATPWKLVSAWDVQGNSTVSDSSCRRIKICPSIHRFRPSSDSSCTPRVVCREL